MATCTVTGEIFDTTELTGVRTGETSGGTSAMFAMTGANCGRTCEMEIIGRPDMSGAISAETTETCGPIAATYGMTSETSGTIAATFAAIVEDKCAAEGLL